MKTRKTLKFFLLVAAAAVLCLILIPIPRTIDQNVRCTVLDQQDPDYRSEVTVTLQGTYTDYLVLHDHFQGQIYLPEHDLYRGSSPIFHVEIGTFNHVNLMYLDSASFPHYPGSFYAAEDLKTFFLWLMVPDEQDPSRSSSRYFITYPEMTFEQLYQIIDGN